MAMTKRRWKELQVLGNQLRRLGPTYAGFVDDMFAEVERLQPFERSAPVLDLAVKLGQENAAALRKIRKDRDRGEHQRGG